MQFIIDENLPDNFPLWNNPSFCHVLTIAGISLDSDIWQYALTNNLEIVTKDTDFYFRFWSAHKSPKIVWLRVGNLRKKNYFFLLKAFGRKLKYC